jgi:hypothetical protein
VASRGHAAGHVNINSNSNKKLTWGSISTAGEWRIATPRDRLDAAVCRGALSCYWLNSIAPRSEWRGFFDGKFLGWTIVGFEGVPTGTPKGLSGRAAGHSCCAGERCSGAARCPHGRLVTERPPISSHLTLQYLLPSPALQLQSEFARFFCFVASISHTSASIFGLSGGDVGM